MIVSLESLLSNEQAITVTAASTNYFDKGATGTPALSTTALIRDLGPGEPLPLECVVNETFTAAGAATLVVTLEMDDNTSFSSPTVMKTSKTWAVADLVAGTHIFNDLYMPTDVTQRYFRLNYTVSTGPMTAGKITAGFSGGRQTNV